MDFVKVGEETSCYKDTKSRNITKIYDYKPYTLRGI